MHSMVPTYTFLNFGIIEGLVTFTFAAIIAVGSIVWLNWLLVSGRSSICFTGWKYFKINIIHVLPGEFFSIIIVL